jgi:hypothetical protein
MLAKLTIVLLFSKIVLNIVLEKNRIAFIPENY